MEGGDWLKDRFQWKNALGSTRNRPGHLNAIWGYWSTDGAVFKFKNPFEMTFTKLADDWYNL